MPALSAALDAVVERHWRAACTGRRLFNGRVFSADAFSPTEIVGHWTEYRRVMAQVADHGLAETLRVQSLAVCGVVIGPDGVVLGRREAASAYQPGLWQCPPAGSVDASAAVPGGADWRRALLGELREELGLGAADIGPMRPLGLVLHPSGVLDMGVLLPTTLDTAAILERHRACDDQEYDRLMVVPPEAAARRVAEAGGTLSPASAAFLRLATH